MPMCWAKRDSFSSYLRIYNSALSVSARLQQLLLNADAWKQRGSHWTASTWQLLIIKLHSNEGNWLRNNSKDVDFIDCIEFFSCWLFNILFGFHNLASQEVAKTVSYLVSLFFSHVGLHFGFKPFKWTRKGETTEEFIACSQKSPTHPFSFRCALSIFSYAWFNVHVQGRERNFYIQIWHCSMHWAWLAHQANSYCDFCQSWWMKYLAFFVNADMCIWPVLYIGNALLITPVTVGFGLFKIFFHKGFIIPRRYSLGYNILGRLTRKNSHYFIQPQTSPTFPKLQQYSSPAPNFTILLPRWYNMSIPASSSHKIAFSNF